MEEFWINAKEILVFGFGRRGYKFLEQVKGLVEVKAIIDNDISKWGTTKDGIPVIGMEKGKEYIRKYPIVVALQEYYYQKIKDQFHDIGLIENKNYIRERDFLISTYLRMEKVFIPKTDLFITSFCNLNCKNCLSFIPYWKDCSAQPLETLVADVDSYFQCIDVVGDFDLIGGEPFSYPFIDELLVYIGSHYRKQINYLGIITNGGIVPKDSTLKIIKKYNIQVSISDYMISDGYEKKVNATSLKLQENEIEFIRNRNIQWFDFGFPENIYNYAECDAKKHMQTCRTVCQTLCDGYIYYCGLDALARKSGLFHPKNDNGRVKLCDINNADFSSKKVILDCCMGINEKGYLDFCRVCGGFGIDNTNEVDTAIQI